MFPKRSETHCTLPSLLPPFLDHPSDTLFFGFSPCSFRSSEGLGTVIAKSGEGFHGFLSCRRNGQTEEPRCREIPMLPGFHGCEKELAQFPIEIEFHVFAGIGIHWAEGQDAFVRCNARFFYDGSAQMPFERGQNKVTCSKGAQNPHVFWAAFVARSIRTPESVTASREICGRSVSISSIGTS